MDTSHYFLEEHPGQGSAFGLKIKAKLHEEQTPYQKIEIYETENYCNMIRIDGFIILTSLDNFLYH